MNCTFADCWSRVLWKRRTVFRALGSLAGRILYAVPGPFLLTTGINPAFVQSPAVRESFARFGYPDGLIPTIGILGVVFAALYLTPRTSVFGALLLTA